MSTCPFCWQEYQHCQCEPNRTKPQTAVYECPKCGRVDCDCGKKKK